MVGSDRIGQVLRTEACVCVCVCACTQEEGWTRQNQWRAACFGADKDIAQA